MTDERFIPNYREIMKILDGYLPPMPGNTLDEARHYVQQNLDGAGVDCPCCDQLAKRYRRKFNSGMAKCLIALVQLNFETKTWVHSREVAAFRSGAPRASANADGQLAKSRFWGLIETKPNTNPSKKDSGLWRPTISGVAFVCGQASIRKTAVVYDNVLEGFEGETISINTAKRDHFDVQELMTGIPVEKIKQAWGFL